MIMTDIHYLCTCTYSDFNIHWLLQFYLFNKPTNAFNKPPHTHFCVIQVEYTAPNSREPCLKNITPLKADKDAQILRSSTLNDTRETPSPRRNFAKHGKFDKQ